ncbi:MAG: hypothetical protein JG766_2327, partial [Desulfacinum sp.]|nr:hypothetical protein [Desulfacinum sp.]
TLKIIKNAKNQTAFFMSSSVRMSPFRAGARRNARTRDTRRLKKRKIRCLSNLHQPLLCRPLRYHLPFPFIGQCPTGAPKTRGSVRDLSAPGRVSKGNASRPKGGKKLSPPWISLAGRTLGTRERPTRARGPKSLPGSMPGEVQYKFGTRKKNPPSAPCAECRALRHIAPTAGSAGTAVPPGPGGE